MEFAKLKYSNDYLQIFMPDGQVIPQQIDLEIKNETGQRKIATAIVTLIVDISEIGEPIDNNDNKEEIVKSLEEKLEITHKSALFWEKLYEKESIKKWYQKLFNL